MVKEKEKEKMKKQIQWKHFSFLLFPFLFDWVEWVGDIISVYETIYIFMSLICINIE